MQEKGRYRPWLTRKASRMATPALLLAIHYSGERLEERQLSHPLASMEAASKNAAGMGWSSFQVIAIGRLPVWVT